MADNNLTVLYFFLVSYAIMFTLKDSKVPGMVPVRRWLIQRSRHLANLFTCSFCLGFHAGWLAYLLFGWAGDHDSVYLTLRAMFISGLASATFCYAFDNFMVFLELKNDDQDTL